MVSVFALPRAAQSPSPTRKRRLPRMLLALASLLLCAAALPSLASAITFSKTNFGVGTSPGATAIGDLNGDGRPDLAVANTNSNSVSVLLASGSQGNFAPAFSLPVQANPYSVAIGDLNGDGRPDIVAANFNSNSVSVLLATGSPGQFAAAANFPVGTRPIYVAIGDLNGDGRPDLAVDNQGSSNVSVLQAIGAPGNFGAPTNYAVGTSSSSVAIGDLNGDGRPDLAVTNGGSNTVSLFFATGAQGSFAAAVNLAAGPYPISVAIGDLNGDGRPDLAIANYTAASVSVFPAAGAQGSFGAPTNYAVGDLPHSVALGDLNGDGRPDLATANYNSNNVSVLLATGAQGSFGATSNFAAGTKPRWIAIGDLNGDARLDLAVANSVSNDVSVLLQTVPTPTLTTSASSATLGSAISDTATLSGGQAPTGTLIFRAYGPGDSTCAGEPAFTSAPVTVTGAGSYGSGDFTPTQGGTYRWIATYSGDTNNNGTAGACNAANETSTVAAPSVALADSGTVGEDSGAITIAVRANDTDANDIVEPVATVTQPAHGSAAVTNSGADVSYTPAADYCGSDSFTYTLDGGSSATVSINVSCVDDPPSAEVDGLVTQSNAGPTTIEVLANDTDIDGGPMTITGASDPANGTVVIASDGRSLTYEPDPTYCNEYLFGTPDAVNGQHEYFTYDLNGGSQGWVDIAVTCDEGARDDSATRGEDSAATEIDVLANDSHPYGDSFRRIESVTDPAHGTTVRAEDGLSLTYRPDDDYCGSDSFDYTGSLGDTATVSVTVTCVADPSVANDDSATVGEDSGATTIPVRANDTDADGIVEPVATVTQPANGSAAVTNSGADVSYTPAADYCGSDSFTYTLDGGSSATVSLAVDCQPEPAPPACPAVTSTAVSYTVAQGRRLHGAQVPGVRARITVSRPSQVEVSATLVYRIDGRRHTAALENLSLRNYGRFRNVHIDLPERLRGKLPLGTRVFLKLAVTSTPYETGCDSPEPSTRRSGFGTRVVKVYAAPQYKR